MCVYSMIMDHAITQPPYIWRQPYFPAQVSDLLRKAKKYDTTNGEPDCELDEKRKALKKIADELGIDISFD